MSFTSKVSNIIKTRVASNFGFANSIKGAMGQPKKLAAKLANKSPLDLSKSPVAHMEAINNPYNYGAVFYPQETSQLGDGHYIIFDIMENLKSGYLNTNYKHGGGKTYPTSMGQVGERKGNRSKKMSQLKKFGFDTNKARTQNSGIAVANPTHTTTISDSIILYTPGVGTKFDYKVRFEGMDTGIAGQLLGLLDGKDKLAKLKDAGQTFLEGITQAALEIVVPGFGGARDKRRGESVNPKAEMVFTGVPFRSFSYPFEFAPKNEQEKDAVQKIISILKFHMMPEKFGPGFLLAPSEFQITYMYKDGPNMYIPKISRCALTEMSIDYSPEGVFTTFKGDDKGAAPVLTTMNLSFTEMEIMTKETIAEGH
jgi:hypothetical protein